MTMDDALLAIDSAIAQLHVARRVLEQAAGSLQAPPADGACRHQRVVQTFSETVCRDCGDVLAGGDGVSSSSDEAGPS
jgi:hypothetical protein